MPRHRAPRATRRLLAIAAAFQAPIGDERDSARLVRSALVAKARTKPCNDTEHREPPGAAFPLARACGRVGLLGLVSDRTTRR